MPNVQVIAIKTDSYYVALCRNLVKPRKRAAKTRRVAGKAASYRYIVWVNIVKTSNQFAAVDVSTIGNHKNTNQPIFIKLQHQVCPYLTTFGILAYMGRGTYNGRFFKLNCRYHNGIVVNITIHNLA